MYRLFIFAQENRRRDFRKIPEKMKNPYFLLWTLLPSQNSMDAFKLLNNTHEENIHHTDGNFRT